MNSITICGNLTKDAEIRYLQNGDPVASFGVADNMGKDKGAIFWNASMFGKRAEALKDYLTKGQTVTVIGTVSAREWTDKDGQKRKSMDVRVNDLALQGGKREQQSEPQRSAPRRSTYGDASDKSEGSANDGMDSDVPF